LQYLNVLTNYDFIFKIILEIEIKKWQFEMIGINYFKSYITRNSKRGIGRERSSHNI